MLLLKHIPTRSFSSWSVFDLFKCMKFPHSHPQSAIAAILICYSYSYSIAHADYLHFWMSDPSRNTDSIWIISMGQSRLFFSLLPFNWLFACVHSMDHQFIDSDWIVYIYIYITIITMIVRVRAPIYSSSYKLPILSLCILYVKICIG